MHKIQSSDELRNNSIFRPWNQQESSGYRSLSPQQGASRSRVNEKHFPSIIQNSSSIMQRDIIQPSTLDTAPQVNGKSQEDFLKLTHQQSSHLRLTTHYIMYLNLLRIARLQQESTNIAQVHQNAMLNAQIQHANRYFQMHPQDLSIKKSCSRSHESPHFSRSSSLLQNSHVIPGTSPKPHSPELPTMYPFPLPSAKDGEPLDLLPKSLYLNKSQGGHLCIFCGKVYSRKYGLKIHLRTHTGYKPLKCKVCSRPFGDPSNLNKHIRLHAEGETPYRCEFCGKVLVRRRDLERHLRSRHPENTDASFSLSPNDLEEAEEPSNDARDMDSSDVMNNKHEIATDHPLYLGNSVAPCQDELDVVGE